MIFPWYSQIKHPPVLTSSDMFWPRRTGHNWPIGSSQPREKKHGVPFWGPRDPGGAHSTAVGFFGPRPYWGKTWDAFCNSILPICGKFICNIYIYILQDYNYTIYKVTCVLYIYIYIYTVTTYMKHIVFNVYGTHVAHVCMQKKHWQLWPWGIVIPLRPEWRKISVHKIQKTSQNYI